MKNYKLNTILLALCLVFFPHVRADIPVHCLHHQVVGEWVFEKDQPQSQDGQPRHHLCGHALPDNPETSNIEMRDFKKATELTVNLFSDNIAKNSDLSGSEGSWTMVYDEGFDIQLNGVDYFAFSKFYKEGRDHKSDCSSTLMGWYNDKSNNMLGCWKGHKSDDKKQINDEVKHAYVVQPEDTFSENQPAAKEKTLVKTAATEPPKTEFSWENSGFLSDNTYEPLNFDKDFTDHQHTVDRLNNVGNAWEASYHSEYEGLSLAQLNSKAGHRARYRTEGKSASKSRKKTYPAKFETDDVSDLPKEFSWKAKLGPIREQKDCGSCYIFATIEMIEARLRIHENEDVKLSVQHAVDCDVYNQGCDGGYPYLVEKFAQEYELVPESCNGYKARNTGECGTCNVNTLKKTYGVSDYYFIGGAYGKSSERNMMEELLNNGPIVTSFEPAYDFMFYKRGVYHSPNEDSWVFEKEAKPEWEKVDHSVLMYGWGEENGEKYWELQNTWGAQWGESGHFRMRRGVDDSAIESLAEAAMPVIYKQSGTVRFIQKSSNVPKDMLRENRKHYK